MAPPASTGRALRGDGITAPPDPLHFADARDIDEFVDVLEKLERGEIGPDQFRAFRLARGTYGQRQPDASMLRVKIPQGILRAEQIEALADIADGYSRGFAHITTRQNVQLHFIALARVPEAMRRLADVGLTTKEACGNTVRNVTACPLAGVCRGAPFDVTPYARAATRHFLRNPICQALPRKFKIAFSGCPDDCAQGAINDVGLVALARPRADGSGDEHGFRVRVAGGLSTTPEDAHPLADFVPADELLPTLEAVVRVFDRTGNRDNKSRARLKYVVRKIGMDGFRAEFERELAGIRADGRGRIPVDDSDGEHGVADGGEHGAAGVRPAPAPLARDAPRRDGFAAFRLHNVIAQRQSGFFAVLVRLVRGDVTAVQLRRLAAIARRFGGGEARTTNDQNILLRFVAEADLPALHGALVDAGLGQGGARTIADVTSCPGADTCNLAVTQSRELATALTDALESPAVAPLVDDAVGALDIKISGCPNSCGQHHVAALGFHGTMRRVGGRAVPEYQLHLGGGIDGGGATFGRQVVKVPARRIPATVTRLLEMYRAERTDGERPLDYFRRVDEAHVKAALADLVKLDEATARPEEYVDLGQEVDFKVSIGQGECAS